MSHETNGRPRARTWRKMDRKGTSVTLKETGLIKAEVPYTDYKILKKAMVTVLLGIFATPYWVSTDSANMTFTSWVRPLDERFSLDNAGHKKARNPTYSSDFRLSLD